jgi:long-subunit acyl-CoA synthetase (AMP-forming)
MRTLDRDQIATVISSGGTGDPKGVMLSRFNIESYIGQVRQVFMMGRRDKILGVLAFLSVRHQVVAMAQAVETVKSLFGARNLALTLRYTRRHRFRQDCAVQPFEGLRIWSSLLF